MQVNVKELTGVSHLKLVFMNVLVLQSFLAVSFSSASVTTFSKSSSGSSISRVHQVFKC